jgi:hypothetical protein
MYAFHWAFNIIVLINRSALVELIWTSKEGPWVVGLTKGQGISYSSKVLSCYYCN